MNGFTPVTTKIPTGLQFPPTWTWALLTTVAKLESGHTPSRRNPEYWGGEVPWLSLKDIQGLTSRYVVDTADKPTMLGIENSSARLLPAGTVALCRTASVGKVAILGREMATSQDFVDWVCGPKLNPEYLYWALFCSSAAFDVEKQGSTHKTIYMPTLERLNVLLPPLDVQKRVAAILDRADAIRRKRREAIALTEQVLRSTFLEMFGDPESAWGMATVEQLAEDRLGAIRTGPFGSQLLTSEFTDSGIAVLGIDNAVENEFRWGRPRYISKEKYEGLRRYTVTPRDVVITIMGTCGRCAIIPDDIPTAINTKHLCCITLDRAKCLPEFLHSYFLFHPTARDHLRKNAKGAVMDGLNMGIISQLPVLLVPLELQRRYQAFVLMHAGLQRRLTESAAEADNLFNSLVQRAFTGQL